MKTVTPTELQKHLSGLLRFVRSGEEIVVVSRGEPIARILPISESTSEHERRLVAAGALKLPTRSVKDWKKFVDSFFARRASNDRRGRRLQTLLVNAVVEEREEGW